MTEFPWVRAMELGLGHLRLAPRDFWSMTLPELAAALGGAGRSAGAISRAGLNALTNLYPDA
tara:strand:+ start:2805 stop:2990 length:186 start_codon:yes stop_codon:yes gene_type:complete